MGCRQDSDAPLSAGDGNTLVCVPGNGHTTWTIEPRGDAYVSAFIRYIFAVHLPTKTGLETLETPGPSTLASVIGM